MNKPTIVIVTGGAGFVGSSIAVWLKSRFPDWRVLSLDNLRRRGSELILPRLRAAGVEYTHCDVRSVDDLEAISVKADWIVDCAAEPSVLAGGTVGSARYVIDNNLMGTVNCLELARRYNSRFIFLSTNRVYPIDSLNSICLEEGRTRYVVADQQILPGVSQHGISEEFPLHGARSLYGATKLSSELMIQEYGDVFRLEYIIDRCGVIAGPWQMGKVDQGVIALWVARHYFGEPLSYIGWGGTGKQVRDVLDIRDLLSLLDVQISRFENYSNQTFNVGGGPRCSVSLCELTDLCVDITEKQVDLTSDPTTRYADIKSYITDFRKVQSADGWSPEYYPKDTVASIFEWLKQNESTARQLFLSK